MQMCRVARWSLGLSLVAVVGCEADTSTVPPLEPALEEVTRIHFGDEVAPEMPIATVGERTITAGEVAAALELFPTLTVEQAVEDLVDTQTLLATAADDALERVEPMRADARRDALAREWVARTLWSLPEVQTADPDEVRAWIEDVERSASFGTPELMRVSHLLIRMPEDASEAEWEAAVQALAEARARILASDRPPAAFDLEAELDALAAQIGDRIPDDEDVVVERHFAFPQAPSGPQRWSGVVAVAPPFAEAAFALEPLTLSEPVRTSFGVHLILAEERIPPYWVSDERRAQMASEFARARPLSSAFNSRLGEVMQRTPIYAYDENLALLSMSAEERLQAEAASRGDRFGGQ